MSSERLTEREGQVLALIAQGLTNQQIADELSLTRSTVRWYARQIYNRLGVEGRQEAVAHALEVGILPEAGLAAPPDNLPASATPFVGRQRELERLDELVGDAASRLITIVGPGGVGKTRLALAAAERQLRPWPDAGGSLTYRFPDGVWFIPLAAVNSAGRLVTALSEAMGLQLEGESGRETVSQLFDYLRAKRMLLVLDNFEQLLAHAAFLTDMLAQAAAVRLLVTSRERLELHGEQVFPIEGLEIPEPTCPAAPPGQRSLQSYPSIQLFLNTARRAQADFELHVEDELPLARICRAVAGFPLGIELAASWVSMLPVAHLADEIENSLELLAANTRDLPPRHRSIRAALDVSWRRLSGEQQRSFQRLCLFRNGFTRQAAYQVAEATLPVLVQLLYKSWLVYDQAADRYHIHELLRQYGGQRLSANPEMEARTQAAHAHYYLTFLKEREADFHTSRQLLAVKEIQVEADNVWQAWRWSVARQDMAGIEQGLESLCHFLNWVGRIEDGESACRAAAEQLVRMAAGEVIPEMLALLARVLTWQSRFTKIADEKTLLLREAQVFLQRATGAGVDTRAERAFLLLQQAEAAEEREVDAAMDQYAEALALSRSLQDHHGIARALGGLSTMAFRLGRLDEVEAYSAESLSICRVSGDRLGQADAQRLLALVYKHREQAQRAEALQHDTIRLYKELNYPLREMAESGNLANTLSWIGDYAAMLEMAESAISIQQALGIAPTAYLLATQSIALLHLGPYGQARQVAEQALKVGQTAGSRAITAFALGALGQIAIVEGAFAEATNRLQESEEITMALWPNMGAEPLALLAYLSLKQGEVEETIYHLERAVHWAQDVHSSRSLQLCLPAAALCAARRGDPERAVELHAMSRQYGFIANSRWFEDVAGQELEEAAARLPAEVADAARQRGRTLDVWQTGEQLLAELERLQKG